MACTTTLASVFPRRWWMAVLVASTVVGSSSAGSVVSPAPPGDVAGLRGARLGGGATVLSRSTWAPLRTGDMPWRGAGLGERQAAAHLIARFTFGARPGEIDRVLARGLERWFEDQLAAAAPEGDLERRLAPLHSLAMPAATMAATYPSPGLLLLQAQREGALPVRERAVPTDGDGAARPGDAAGVAVDGDRLRRNPELRDALLRFVADHGYRRQGELLADLLTQKVLRATYAENQLAEVMTDFWCNHFNVATTDPQARVYVLAYERDAIRPHALGSFYDLLAATARHPAMLLYLDNARSVAPLGAVTTLAVRLDDRWRRGSAMGRRGGFGGAGLRGGWGGGGRRTVAVGGAGGRAAERGTAGNGLAAALGDRRPTGINENYARELLELHTLGVDGGYTQQDVVEVARAFTGWTVVPPRMLVGDELEGRLARAQRLDVGMVREGPFLFRPDAHDAGSKTLLGARLAPGRGIEDGEEVLALLAAHPATAHHLASQIAARFVSDQPPPALVDRLAAVFAASGGDTRAVLRALVRSPELWSAAARGQKVKSPFELTVSALRVLDAEVTSVAAVVDWVARMGQPLYAQQAPTGWPDRAEAWVNTGALLARMSFGIELASGGLHGVTFDLGALVGNREPESPQAALAAFGAVLLPEREGGVALRRLAPRVEEPALGERLGASATAAPPGMDMTEQRLGRWEDPFPDYRRDRARRPADRWLEARVVGVLLGSPEFQRR